jgi:ubiquitin-like 1-activating enzyme E1 B
MNFVAACANIRAHIFHIATKSLFDIKAMAGNIIPAIATTNACVAGMLVLEALKVIRKEFDKTRWVYINRKPNPRGKILMDEEPAPPRKNCYICSDRREVLVAVNLDVMLLKTFQAKVLKQQLCMNAPDVTDVLTSRILISSEEGETDAIMENTLGKLGVRHGSQLDCDDFLQQLNLKIVIFHDDKLNTDEYKMVSDSSEALSEPIASNVDGMAIDDLKRKRHAEDKAEASSPKRSRID